MSKLPPKFLERLKKRGIIKDEEPQPKKPCTESAKQSPFIVNGCPNKYNEYHDCSNYCEIKYGNGMEYPSPRIKKIYENLIQSYPLQENWESVWECGCARFYFYNTSTNEVSWYPPGHSKFKTTKPINIIKGIPNLENTISTTLNKQTDNELIEKQLNEENNKFTDELNKLDKELNDEFNNSKELNEKFNEESDNKSSSEESSSESDDD